MFLPRLTVSGLIAASAVLAAGVPPAPTAAPAPAVVLSPFEVSGEPDRGYGALNSNSITRFNVELEKMPVSADIMNEAFMQDIAAFGVESMLRDYAAGAGTYGADPSSAAGANNPMDRFDSMMSLRGLGAPTMQRDAFMPAKASSTSMGFTTNFDLERVEVINGPQSLLYGFSGAGGAINLVPKQARFNQPASGSLRFQVDQHGHKQVQFDFGAGRRNLAFRGAATRQVLGNRRVFLDGTLEGLYGQLAWRVFDNTTLRFSDSATVYRRLYQTFSTLTALSTTNDARNGLSLRYLLATNQIDAAAGGGASGAGVIGNGRLTWDNVDSIAGRALSDYTRAHQHSATADTVWSRLFSTQVAAGYSENYAARYANGTAQFIAPNVATNSTGTWAVAPNTINIIGHTRAKAVRLSGVLSHGLPGLRFGSQTVFGGDYTRTNFNRVYRGYARVDASGAPIINPSPTAATNGYSLLARPLQPIPDGPVRDSLSYEPGARNIVVNGVAYTEIGTNEPVPALVSAANPLGLTGRGQGGRNANDTIVKGVYAANFTNWLDGRLTTLAGIRAGKVWAQRDDIGTVLVPSVRNLADSTAVSVNLGVNYALLPWLRPYVSFSDSHTPPTTVQGDPYGASPGNSRGTGGEVGFKFGNERRVSGTVAYYEARSSDEQYLMQSALTSIINPSGLNGEFRAPDSWITVSRRSRGLQVAATASPGDGWRLRLSASTFESIVNTDRSYAQLYNDQFFANSRGEVAYRDGSTVYVSQTATQVVPSTTAGAVPLTLALLNNPSSRYYANPDPDTARINPASGAATALRTVDPVRGPILTGVTGLPISSLQVAPNPASPPPGVIVASRAGDLAPGTPRYSVNLTGIHTFSAGGMRGVRLGGTVAKAWQLTSYYYYEPAVTSSARRLAFVMPRPVRFDAILGYERKVGRYRLSTQLNVNNLFNRYDVVLLPSATTGFLGARGTGIGATFNTEPRLTTWSFSVGF